jgi:hypothetical protein
MDGQLKSLAAVPLRLRAPDWRRSPSTCWWTPAVRPAGWRGLLPNRTDFIRTAIRNQLAARRADPADDRPEDHRPGPAHRKQDWKPRWPRAELWLRVLGLIRIAKDVSPKLARDAIESLEILGALEATPAVKAALADRIT